MEPQFVAIVGLHLVGAMAFSVVAVHNALAGDVAGAVLQGVVAFLVVTLGLGIVRSA